MLASAIGCRRSAFPPAGRNNDMALGNIGPPIIAAFAKIFNKNTPIARLLSALAAYAAHPAFRLAPRSWQADFRPFLKNCGRPAIIIHWIPWPLPAANESRNLTAPAREWRAGAAFPVSTPVPRDMKTLADGDKIPAFLENFDIVQILEKKCYWMPERAFLYSVRNLTVSWMPSDNGVGLESIAQTQRRWRKFWHMRALPPCNRKSPASDCRGEKQIRPVPCEIPARPFRHSRDPALD